MPTSIPQDANDKRSGRRVTAITILIILALLIVGIVVGEQYLSPPYYAIAHLIAYAIGIVVVWRKSTICIRLVPAGELHAKLFSVRFWIGLTAIGVLIRGGEVYRSTDRHFIMLATNLGLLLALSSALQLVERLLKAGTVDVESLPSNELS